MRQITFGTFQNICQRYAAVMGRKRGVTVSFGGSTAYAAQGSDGRHHLNIPAMPPGTLMTPHLMRVFNGYIDHESGHLRYTDFQLLELDRDKEPLKAYFRNLVEDIRIENRQISEYPGCRKNLDALAYHVDQETEKEVAKRPGPPTQASLILGLIYKECYAKYRGVDTGTVKGWLSDHAELKPIEDYLAQEMPKLDTCTDTMRIAQGIEDRLPKNIDWSAPADQDRDDLILIVVGTAPGPGTPGGPMPKSGTYMVLLAAAKDADQHEKRKAIIKNIQQLIQQQNQPSGIRASMPWGDSILPPCSTAYDKTFVVANHNQAIFEATRNACSAETLALKKMLTLYLRTRKKRTWSRGLEEGVLDTEMLPQLVALGNTKVMKEKRETDLMDTAILILGDCSSSMDEHLLRTGMIMLGEALGTIPKLKLAIAGFTTNDASLPRQAGCGRAIGVDIMLYKEFDEPYLKARTRLGSVETYGYTPLGDAYGKALEFIIQRKEKRKVIWLLSDGDPFLTVADHKHSEPALMRQVHAKCQRLGVETVGTYIGHGGNLKSYVDKYQQVSQARDMPSAVLGIVRSIV